MSDITATTRGEKAKQLYAKGYNCAQAVALGICVDGFVSWGAEPLWYPI